ncbi:MAG: adenylate/guanylate cyclase domain-containing protein [Acidobacteria bacterium]|nr:adenylate/guanylate cyclase domain-containing protein [Acidobacteriota bacterium]
MKKPAAIRRPLLASLVLAALVCLVVASLEGLGFLEPLEWQGYDLLVSRSSPASPPAELAIVDFDDATDQALHTFPIPRALLAEVVEKVAVGEPALIGLDVLLDEKRAPADDARLAEALGRAGTVVLAEHFGSDQLPASHPLPEFRQQAFDVGFVNLPVDADGFVRRMFLFVRTPDYQGLSFPAVLASNFLGQPLAPGRPGAVRLGSLEIPVLGANTALIGAWSLRPAALIVPVHRLLAAGFDSGVFKGKIVLIGQSSAKGKDLYANTPVFRFRKPAEGRTLLSGTEIHAAAVATLLKGRTVAVGRSAGLWGLNFFLASLVILLVVTLRPQTSLPAGVAALLGTYLLAQSLFTAQQLWVRFVSTEACLLLGLPAGLGYRFLEERRLKAHAEAERRELMSLFERYVSPDVAAEIWERRGEIVLSGQEKTAAVLFSDIRNFTALTAGKPSAEVLAWLNDYFTAMSEVIKRNGGFLNKFIGDGLLVVFGVPLSDGSGGDARRAVQTALEMLERVKELNTRQEASRPRLEIGIGIHSGPLTAGNVGARDRLEYSVIGESVNLASRLEALCKEFRTSIVISPQVRALVQDRFDSPYLGEAEVRGFPEKISVYTVRKKKPAEGGR